MKKKYTQTECKAMWQNIKDNNPSISDIEDIDSKTPWSTIEPEWWIEMMAVHKNLIATQTK